MIKIAQGWSGLNFPKTASTTFLPYEGFHMCVHMLSFQCCLGTSRIIRSDPIPAIVDIPAISYVWMLTINYFLHGSFLFFSTRSLWHLTWSLVNDLQWVKCSPMVREMWIQSQVESYQRLKITVFDATLLSTRHCKAMNKGKVEQSRKWSTAIPYTTV